MKETRKDSFIFCKYAITVVTNFLETSALFFLGPLLYEVTIMWNAKKMYVYIYQFC